MVISLLEPVVFEFGAEKFSLSLCGSQAGCPCRGLLLVPDSACGFVEFSGDDTFVFCAELPVGGISFGVSWGDFYRVAPAALVYAENAGGEPLLESEWAAAATAALRSAFLGFFGVAA